MAQTKRKRRSKHRGTAAGQVQVRGRTSRPASPDERKKAARQEARDKRLNSPPTWKSSIRRAGLACGLMFVFLIVLGLNSSKKGSNPVIYALFFSIFALLLYVPAGYYLEMWFWRRRMRRREEQRQAQR